MLIILVMKSMLVAITSIPRASLKNVVKKVFLLYSKDNLFILVNVVD